MADTVFVKHYREPKENTAARKIYTERSMRNFLHDVAMLMPYSPVLEHIEDVEYNGHIISVKSSRQMNQVVVDSTYEYVKSVCIQYKNLVYDDPIDYLMKKLNK